MYKKVPIFRCTTPSTGKRIKEFEVVVGAWTPVPNTSWWPQSAPKSTWISSGTSTLAWSLNSTPRPRQLSTVSVATGSISKPSLGFSNAVIAIDWPLVVVNSNAYRSINSLLGAELNAVRMISSWCNFAGLIAFTRSRDTNDVCAPKSRKTRTFALKRSPLTSATAVIKCTRCLAVAWHPYALMFASSGWLRVAPAVPTGALLAPGACSFCRASCNNAWCFRGHFVHLGGALHWNARCPRWRQFQHKNLFFTKATRCPVSVSDNFFSTSSLFVATPNVPAVVVGEDEISSCTLRLASEPLRGCVATKLAASALSASHFEKTFRSTSDLWANSPHWSCNALGSLLTSLLLSSGFWTWPSLFSNSIVETRFETAFEKSIRPTISPSRGDGKLFVRLISDSTIKSGRPNLRSRVSITCVRFPGSDNNEETVSFAFPLRAFRSLAIFSACENLHSADDARNCSKNTGHSSGSPEKLGSSLLANDCLATKCRRSSLSFSLFFSSPFVHWRQTPSGGEDVMVLLRKGVLTSGCTHVHTSQFRYSVYLQLYLSIQFSIVFALDRCSWVRWLSGSLLCRDFVEIVTKPVLSFRKGSDDSPREAWQFFFYLQMTILRVFVSTDVNDELSSARCWTQPKGATVFRKRQAHGQTYSFARRSQVTFQPNSYLTKKKKTI